MLHTRHWMRQRKIQRIRAHTHLDHTVDATVRLFDTMVAGKGEAADLAGYAIARAAVGFDRADVLARLAAAHETAREHGATGDGMGRGRMAGERLGYDQRGKPEGRR